MKEDAIIGSLSCTVALALLKLMIRVGILLDIESFLYMVCHNKESFYIRYQEARYDMNYMYDDRHAKVCDTNHHPGLPYLGNRRFEELGSKQRKTL